MLNGIIVMSPVNVGGDDGGKVASIFLSVGSTHGINKSFGVGVSFIGEVRGAVVNHGFVNGVACLVGEDAGGKTGD
jgi:ethanolamine ammonia-lyase large subunit